MDELNDLILDIANGHNKMYKAGFNAGLKQNVNAELLEACKTAENELTKWLASQDCDCPPEGHMCGFDRVMRNRKELQQAIQKAEGI